MRNQEILHPHIDFKIIKIGEKMIVHILTPSMNGDIFNLIMCYVSRKLLEEFLVSHNSNTVPMRNVPQKQNMNTANEVILCGDHTG